MTRLANITVLGTGVLGSQIAYQIAYSGFSVVAYDVNADVIEHAKERVAGLVETYQEEVAGAGEGRARQALANLSYSFDLADAVKDADLVIEAVPEDLDLKRDTFAKLAALAPEKTIFATNSSTLLPSDLLDSTGRPARFLALHFATGVWIHNMAEVMGTEKTDPAVYETIIEFAGDIGMVPIALRKEKAGYLLNSLLVPFLAAAGELIVNGIADPDMIDKTWRIGVGASTGPFQIFDTVGLTTAYNIFAAGAPNQREFAAYLKEHYIDKGKLGVCAGEGFYRYPKG